MSGKKAQLIDRIVKRAVGSVAITFDENIGELDEDENMPSSTHDGTLSDSEYESSENEGGSGDSYVEHSFGLLMKKTCHK